MKRSLKILALLISFVGAYSASAELLTNGNYAGSGKWKKTSGEQGEYTVQATLNFGDEELSISQVLDFGDRTLDLNFVVRKIDDTFYEVVNSDGEVVGEGYCWELGESGQGKICHSDSVIGDDYVESTIKIFDGKIYRVGSKTSLATYEKTIWKDLLERQGE